ncbi:unnamed protein product [Caretta caretta]
MDATALFQEVIEELPDDSPPGAVLANSLIAVGNLRSPPKGDSSPHWEVSERPKSHTLLWVSQEVIEELPNNSPPSAILVSCGQPQDLHRVLPDIVDALLGNLLAESPGTDRLHYLLEHISYWIVSRVSRDRGRAIRSITALLRSTITLPEFDNSDEFPRMAHHVAQLALFVSDPSKDISWQAREGVYRLYQLLLHDRCLTIHEAKDLWVWDWHQDSRLLGYKTTARVGEVRTLRKGTRVGVAASWSHETEMPF